MAFEIEMKITKEIFEQYSGGREYDMERQGRRGVIDKERGLMMLVAGGMDRGKYTIYELFIDGEPVVIKSEETSKPREREQDKPRKFDDHHDIKYISVAPDSKLQADIVCPLVVEGLIASGHNCNAERTGTVTVDGLTDSLVNTITFFKSNWDKK